MTKNRKILVISDTHGLVLPLKEIFNHHSDVTAIFHCGDSELMNFDPILKNIHIVRGNCDYDRTLPNELFIKIGQHKIYMTHGHMHGVKSSLDKLHNSAQQKGAEIALYGHSHIAKASLINGILLVNPGSIAYPRGRKEKTYAIITLNKDKNHQVDFYLASTHEPLNLACDEC
ncbi:metallophosphoesterase [Wohlfahrtiimonas larvae]|uniref:Phosphoesterase n=1 Tax=Wohlfahrtiimonas larvae TaxID=1157986 RepID=A0ABP9MQU1_9GAMM|nr:metallophosphoesterase [Wohlfahrtiimonas larvae]